VRDGLAPPEPPACLLAAGETTVEVTGSGTGGPNQEVAVAGASLLDGRDGIVLASLGTDGIDGPTDAAGGMVDGATVSRARDAGWRVQEALEGNDAYGLLEATGDLIHTGPTGTNVADLMLVLIREG
jgi:glycerate-2-kinase